MNHAISYPFRWICMGLALSGFWNLVAAPEPEASDRFSLAGEWRFQLDREDVGVDQGWFADGLKQRIQLPGALQNQGFGDDITVDTKWTGAVGTERWLNGPQYEKYRQPGNIKVPFFLQPEKHYVGAAWYQRDFRVPDHWRGKRVVLALERPHWETRVWVDNGFLGSQNSLATPHVYDLGTDLKPGRHTLTIRVDNRIVVDVGDWSHSVSDHTQGNWNGVIGRIELFATSPVWIADLQVFPNVAAKSVTVKGTLGNTTGKTGTGTVHLAVASLPPSANVPAAPSRTVQVSWTAKGGAFEADYSLGENALLWDEFQPALYRLTATLDQDRHAQSVTFGLREITAANRRFLINGRRCFFRGTLECCIFPLTGYPPTEVDYWQKIIRACQAHGLNHIRFHSWCPPEAAFVAADEMGFYYQVECGVWTQPGNGTPIDQWIYDESERIVRAYGNHPSFVLFTHGNEPHGPNRETYLGAWVKHWTERDPRRLVTSGSAYPQIPENQYHVMYTPRGTSGWLGKDYQDRIADITVPVVSHEIGQWCVYPNFDEVAKYTGPLHPKNCDIFRDSLAEHGMLGQGREFLRASGRLQVLCYKEEIEAALRTPGLSGFQLLDLHDFPGQGTALVGVLDPFWESKGYVSPEQFRRFSNTTVPLARLGKRAWTADETLTCPVEVAHFGPRPLETSEAGWEILTSDGRSVAHGQLDSKTVPVGKGTSLGEIRVNLSTLAAPAAYRLVVRVEKPAASTAPQRFENDWNIWVYPAAPEDVKPDDVLFTTTLDDAAWARLEAGGNVFLATSKLSPAHPKLTFEPIFWNRYMFNTQNRQTLGLVCDPTHPALARFPTDFHQDWQWHDIVTRARGVVLDELPPALRPIVQPIDDWNTNRKLGLLFECRVGPGKLLVCAADLSADLDRRPAARQLQISLLAYAASADFNPQSAVAPEQLTEVLHWAARSTLVNLGAKVVRADSEDRAHGNTADKVLDGDPDTIWHTEWGNANPPFPHEIVIDLQRPLELRGFRLLPRQDQQNGWFTAYEFYLSNDGQQWGTPVAQGTWAADAAEKSVEFSKPQTGRFIRLVALQGHRNNPWAAIAELDILPARALK